MPKAQNQLHQNAWMRWFFAVFIFVLWTHFNWWVKCTVNVIIENKKRWISQMKFHKAFRNLSIFIKGSISKPRSILYSFNFSINTTPTQKDRLDFNIKWFLILLYEVRNIHENKSWSLGAMLYSVKFQFWLTSTSINVALAFEFVIESSTQTYANSFHVHAVLFYVQHMLETYLRTAHYIFKIKTGVALVNCTLLFHKFILKLYHWKLISFQIV